MSVKSIEETVDLKGTGFFTKRWTVPEGKTRKAKILFQHGFSEHCNFHGYDEAFTSLATDGYEVFMFDQRGGGRTSTGKDIGNTNDFYVFGDLDFFVERETRGFDGKLFLCGHSMGGGIVLNYPLVGNHKDKIAGVVACAPMIINHPSSLPHAAIIKIAEFAARLFPKMKYTVNLGDEKLTHDDKHLDFIRKDTLSTLQSTLGALNDAINRGKRLMDPKFVDGYPDIPVLVQHGDGDLVNDYKGSEKFIEILKVSDKKLINYPGAYHCCKLTIYKEMKAGDG